MSTTDRLVEALTALCAREGGEQAVADAIRSSKATIWQITHRTPLPSGRPRSVGRDLQERLSARFPDWMDAQDWDSSQHTTEGLRGISLAHDVSHPQNMIHSPEVQWELILSKELPKRFQLKVRDDAMVLEDPPSMRTGDLAEFVRADAAKPGQVVLVRDRDGHVYIRRYQEKRPGHWLAVPRNSAYQALDSLADGLTVIAIQVGGTWG